MKNVPAIAGWQWIKQGFGLFRRQPAEMSMLFVLYFFVNGLLSMLPVLGPILLLVLAPVFSMAFMQACANIERGGRVYPKVLFSGFRAPAIKSLLVLGVLYLLAAVLALLSTGLIDGGAFWQAINSPTPPDVKAVGDSRLPMSMLIAAFVYLSVSLLLWYAAPLIAWQNMPVGKAIFFSFFAAVRAIKAFLVYLLAWMTIFMVVSFTISALLSALLIDNIELGGFLLLPFVMLITVVLKCSFYPSYTQIFGIPQVPEET